MQKLISGIELIVELAEADTTRLSRTRLDRYFEPCFHGLEPQLDCIQH